MCWYKRGMRKVKAVRESATQTGRRMDRESQGRYQVTDSREAYKDGNRMRQIHNETDIL